ncbi:pseudouridine synthase [Paraburkholderia bryophila]|uniref:pseudouridine synthase n=1 Tax=Paraburkholderia bryophila TaxID=420952 RepID=UPI00234BCD4B|nr:pseudouridine synthase [Paraburkholderia bryophila]WCM18213.1 pseudouridine synthase [Paraburkholderia bryophila]
MRLKLTAKHPRPASSERAPVRTGSSSGRKPTRPAGPKPSTAGFSGAHGEGSGAPKGAGTRPAGGKPAGAGARAPRAEGSFSRERDAGGAGRSSSDRPPRREGAGDRGERAPRKFEGGGDRGDRAPRSFGDRPPRRDDGERRPFSGARPGAGRPSEGGARGDRPVRNDRDGGDRARFGGERAPRSFGDRPPRREDGERAPRSFGDRPPRRDDGERRPFSTARGDRPVRSDREGGDRPRFGGERGPRSDSAPRRFEGAGNRGERGSSDRGERAPRSFGDRPPRREDGERAPRSFGDRPPRRDDGERRPFSGARGDRPVRSDREGGDRPRFGGERAPRSDSAPRRFEGAGDRGDRSSSDRGERAPRSFGDRPPRKFEGTGDRNERSFTKREFGDRPARTGERTERTDRSDRPARSFDKTLPPAGRRFGDDRPARADKPRSPAPAARAEHNDADATPRTPRRDYEDAPGTLRLSKLMSELGLCSRREADEWIEKGWVLVDGERIDTLGTKVRPDQRIEIDPAAEAAQASQVTVLIHKPVGLVSGQAEDGYQPAITLVTPENRWADDQSDIRFSISHLRQLAPAGRLDIDSTGLLVLTQDGRIAKQLIGGHSEIDKEYLVRVAYGEHTVDVESHFPPESLELLCHGLSLDDQPLKPAQVNWQNGEQLRFVLREGKKRQIRRMCELVGLEVIGLKRVRMGRVVLGALPPGQWRYLAADESF